MAWSLFSTQPSYDGAAPQASGQGAGILGLFPKVPEYETPKLAAAPSADARAKFEATLSEDEQQVNLRVHIPGMLSFEGNVPTAHVLLAFCQALPFLSEIACGGNGAAPNPNQEEVEDDELM